MTNRESAPYSERIRQASADLIVAEAELTVVTEKVKIDLGWVSPGQTDF